MKKKCLSEKFLDERKLKLFHECIGSIEGNKIVSTNGCFDQLHWGHIHYLQQSKKKGTILVVGINSDKSVEQIKCKTPLNNQDIRAAQVAALSCVDYVYIFKENEPSNFLSILKPNIHTKGSDYTKESLKELKVLKEMKTKIVLIPVLPYNVTVTTVKHFA